jgi:hypothetical protein
MSKFSAISWRNQVTFRSDELLSSLCTRRRLSKFTLVSHYLHKQALDKSTHTIPFSLYVSYKTIILLNIYIIWSKSFLSYFDNCFLNKSRIKCGFSLLFVNGKSYVAGTCGNEAPVYNNGITIYTKTYTHYNNTHSIYYIYWVHTETFFDTFQLNVSENNMCSDVTNKTFWESFEKTYCIHMALLYDVSEFESFWKRRDDAFSIKHFIWNAFDMYQKLTTSERTMHFRNDFYTFWKHLKGISELGSLNS